MKLLVITGPTASGKTARAVAAARAFDGEIISADSRQVYRGMDLGTGKDLNEYGSVPYHLIDIRPAGHKYNLYEYLRDARRAKEEIESRGKRPIICGGTGMYIEAFLNGLALPEVPENPELRERLSRLPLEKLTEILASMKTLHNITDVDTVKRAVRAIEIQTYYLDHPDEAAGSVPASRREEALIIGTDIPRDLRRRRISERLRRRLDDGMADEVRRLLAEGIAPDDLIYYGLEYKFLTLYATGQLDYGEMVSGLETAIHQFAKRQMTWFRGMERRGFHIEWIPWDLPEEEFTERIRLLDSNPGHPMPDPRGSD